MINKIHHGDCLEIMPLIPDQSVDMVFSDFPYGATNFKWDKLLPLDKIWEQYERIVKPNGAIVLTAQQPFATDLINSNRKLFRYECIWQKTQKTNFANAKKMPLRGHENVLIFYKKLPTYNPQKYFSQSGIRQRFKKGTRNGLEYDGYSGGFDDEYAYQNKDGMMMPDSVIKISNWNGAIFGNTKNCVSHGTRKPVDLCRYFILTYSNIGDTVLDNCSGSGSTIEACIIEGRNFIGIEKDEKEYIGSLKNIANTQKRIESQLFKPSDLNQSKLF